MFTHGNRLLGSLVGEMAARRHAEPRELYPLTSEPTGGPNAFLLPTGGRRLIWSSVITCVVEYVIDATKIDAFERFARRWMELVNLRGSTHHGYVLPAEGASDRALALFSFPASPHMSNTVPCSAKIQNSSLQTGSEMTAAACCDTSGPSCARSFPSQDQLEWPHSDKSRSALSLDSPARRVREPAVNENDCRTGH